GGHRGVARPPPGRCGPARRQARRARQADRRGRTPRPSRGSAEQARQRGRGRLGGDRRGAPARPARAGAARRRRRPGRVRGEQADTEKEVLDKVRPAMAKKDKKKSSKKEETKAAETDALAAIRSAVERTLSASAEGATATRERTRE